MRYIHPFPKNLEEILGNYKKILIPELNNGQLIHIIRDTFLIAPEGFTKIQGVPFNEMEILIKITDIIKELQS